MFACLFNCLGKCLISPNLLLRFKKCSNILFVFLGVLQYVGLIAIGRLGTSREEDDDFGCHLRNRAWRKHAPWHT